MHALYIQCTHIYSQLSSASPVNEQTTADEMDPTYDDVITITHSPHPTTGVLYTDVNVETKKMVQMTAEVDDGSIYQVHLRTVTQLLFQATWCGKCLETSNTYHNTISCAYFEHHHNSVYTMHVAALPCTLLPLLATGHPPIITLLIYKSCCIHYLSVYTVI